MEANYNLAKECLISGDTKTAQKYFKLARITGMSKAEYLGYMGITHLLSNNYKELSQLFQKNTPSEGRLLYSYYYYLKLTGEAKKAGEVLGRMLHGADYFLRFFALKEYARSGKQVDTDQVIRKAGQAFIASDGLPTDILRLEAYSDGLCGRFELALTQIRALMKRYPAFRELYLDYLDIYTLSGDDSLLATAMAEPEFLRAVDYDYRLMSASAREFYRLGEMSRAQYYLQILVRVFPKNTAFHYNLANAYSQAGNTDEAEYHYRKVIALLPDFSLAYHNLGTMYLDFGKPAMAAKILESAVGKSPEPNLLLNLCYSLIGKHDYVNAYRYLNELGRFGESYHHAAQSLKEKIRQSLLSA